MLPLYFHDDRCCWGYCHLGRAGHERARARDAEQNASEPDGSYGLCWKRVYPDDGATPRCALKPNHAGECTDEADPE